MSKIKNNSSKWAKQPVIQFMIIGVVMFLVQTYIINADTDTTEDDYKIYLTAGEVKSMEEVWTSKWQRPPTEIEMKGMVNQRVEEAILFREAKKIGLDKNDNIIRQRMAQKLEFLTNDLVKPDSVSIEEVKLYFTENTNQYTTPANITMIQLFVNPKNYGDSLDKEIATRLAKLNRMDPASPKIAELGDQFSLQTYYPDKPHLEFAKLYGSDFATRIFELETEKWVGPVNSQYGAHLVYIMNKNPALITEFNTIKELVTEDLQREKQIELNNKYINGILSRYEVVVEEEQSDN